MKDYKIEDNITIVLVAFISLMFYAISTFSDIKKQEVESARIESDAKIRALIITTAASSEKTSKEMLKSIDEICKRISIKGAENEQK